MDNNYIYEISPEGEEPFLLSIHAPANPMAQWERIQALLPNYGIKPNQKSRPWVNPFEAVPEGIVERRLYNLLRQQEREMIEEARERAQPETERFMASKKRGERHIRLHLRDYGEIDHNAVLALIGEVATGERFEYKNGTNEWYYAVASHVQFAQIDQISSRLREHGYIVHMASPRLTAQRVYDTITPC